MTSLKKEISALINKHSREQESNTPDYILAEYLISSLKAFEVATNFRDSHFKGVEKRTTGGWFRILDSDGRVVVDSTPWEGEEPKL